MRTTLRVHCSPIIKHCRCMGWSARRKNGFIFCRDAIRKGREGECRSEAFTSSSLFSNRIRHCLTSFYHYFHILKRMSFPALCLFVQWNPFHRIFVHSKAVPIPHSLCSALENPLLVFLLSRDPMPLVLLPLQPLSVRWNTFGRKTKVWQNSGLIQSTGGWRK